MANYSIVLNLRGSAVTNSKKLADNLERADKAAKSLKGNLANMPNVPTGGRGGYYGGGGGGYRPSYGSSFGSVSAVTSLSTQSGLGTVFRFTGQLNSALAIVDGVFRAAAAATKIVAKSNLLFYGGGVSLLKKGADILTSSQMGEGIRLLQRRQQARLGFGAGYAEAQSRADLLAASYGLDPSNVIASMNVLAGMRIGNKRISTAQAERLTQVGGLIAQQSGMSFETVMVNIQQMMAQAVPSMRDIRQLLTHAPILGRYALDEMEKRGVTGMTAMEFLKSDKGAVMGIFERYLNENPALLAMKARGIVQQSQTGFYATLAQNPSWLNVADKYSEVMASFANSISKIITALTGATSINTSINAFLELLNDAPTLIDSFASKLDTWLADAGEQLGINVGGYKERAQVRTESEEQIRKYVTALLPSFRDFSVLTGVKNPSDEVLVRTIMSELSKAKGGISSFISYEPFETDLKTRTYGFGGSYTESVIPVGMQRQQFKKRYGYSPDFMFSDRIQSYVGGNILNEKMIKFLAGQVNAYNSPASLTADAAMSGEAISGYGSDRKSLVINFNAPIVEWDSTINADDPQDVVNTVSENIEGAASRAIQIALLGATGTMSSRF